MKRAAPPGWWCLSRGGNDPGDSADNNLYDQIAWFTTNNGAFIDLNSRTGGNLDFQPHIYSDKNLTRISVSFRVSDHFPLWVEFGL